jgi:isopenicillin N synthase-like dioxygenase
MSTIPLIDLEPYLSHRVQTSASTTLSGLPPSVQEDCKNIALAFHEYGSLAIKDPRANQEDNQRFLDLMEDYFKIRSKEFYEHQSLKKLTDCFPEHGFETGVTPEYIEKARNHSERMDTLEHPNDSFSPSLPEKDAKWRYMYFIGNKDAERAELAPEAHIPSDFPVFKETFDTWGFTMLNAVEIVTEMASLGLDFPRDYFNNLLNGGQHLLSPTGADLLRHKEGTVFAAYHYDFNFLTIHGKSRYPGLYIWLRDNTKIPVIVPDDTLLLQSGKQFEMLTGGYIQCGFHEVVYTDKTTQKYQENLKEKGEEQWRVSSTLFSHMRHDVLLNPRGHFDTEDSRKAYIPLTSYELLEEELKAINLHPDTNDS